MAQGNARKLLGQNVPERIFTLENWHLVGSWFKQRFIHVVTPLGVAQNEILLGKLLHMEFLSFSNRSWIGLHFITNVLNIVWVSLVAQMIKNLLVMQETWVQFLGKEDSLEKGMATHSNILAWRILWTEEPGEHNPWNYKELAMTEWQTLSLNTLNIIYTHLRNIY